MGQKQYMFKQLLNQLCHTYTVADLERCGLQEGEPVEQREQTSFEFDVHKTQL